MLRWFYLCVSLPAILSRPPGVPFVRALLQLFEEQAYHFASAAERSIKAIRARPAERSQADEQQLSSSLQRSNGKVLYEHLLTPHVAHAISGPQVIIGLCGLLLRLYKQLGECSTATPGLADAVSKVDDKIYEGVLKPAVRHGEALAYRSAKAHLTLANPIYGRILGKYTCPQNLDGEFDEEDVAAAAASMSRAEPEVGVS